MHFSTVSVVRDAFGELLKRLNREALERFCVAEQDASIPGSTVGQSLAWKPMANSFAILVALKPCVPFKF